MNQKRITNQILEQKNYTLNSTLNYLFNISNMKKLFSYLLISSMVVLSSCTNYDDQFDDLNTQINTLKTQIEGFSSLSSGLTALQGTVASLQTAIANIPVTPATDISGLESTQAALTASLTALAADVKALQDTLATAATAAEVAALQTALTAAQSDLTELLASNNVYTPAASGLVINSSASLEVAKSLGGKLAIINGGVNITNGTANGLNAADLQAVLDKMVTITGTMTYTQSGTGSSVNFDALTSAGNLSIDNEHAISLAALSNVGTLTVSNDVKVTSFSAPKLATVAFASHTLDLPKATKIDLSSLAAYNNGTLTINGNNVSAGYDLMLPKIQSNGPDGVVRSLTLNIGGYANNVTLPLMVNKNSTINADNAKTIVLAAFNGTLNSGSGTTHVDVTLGAAMKNYTAGPKLEKAMITGILTAAATTANAAEGPTFNFDNASKLVSATIAGKADDVSFDGNTNVETVVVSADAVKVGLTGATSLTSATISGDMRGDIDFTGATSLTSATLSGRAGTVTFDGNTSLTSVAMTGSAATVIVTGASVLTALDLAHTTASALDQTKGTATAATGQAGSLHVYSNPELTSLKADKIATIGSLKVYDNDNLASVSFDAISAPAAAYTGVSTIWVGATVDSNNDIVVSGSTNNKLNAQSIVETAAVDLADGSDRATATITSNSGLSDLAAMITAARADAKNDVAVVFDGIDSYTTLAGVVTTARTYSNDAAKVTIANFATLTNGTAVAGVNIQDRVAETFIDTDDLTLTFNGIAKTFDASSYDTVALYLAAISGDHGIPDVTVSTGSIDKRGRVLATAATASGTLNIKLALGSTAKTGSYTGTAVEFTQVSYTLDVGTDATKDAQAAAIATLLNAGNLGVYTATHTFSSTVTFASKYFAYESAGSLYVIAKKDVSATVTPTMVVDRMADAVKFQAYNVDAAGATVSGLSFGTWFEEKNNYVQILDGTKANTAITAAAITGNTTVINHLGESTVVTIAPSTAYTAAGVASTLTNVPYASNLSLAAEVVVAGATSNARTTAAAADVYFNTTYYTWN